MNLNPAESDMQAAVPTPDIKPPDVNVTLHSKNLAEDLDDELLNKLSDQCKNGFNVDKESRSHWEDDLDDWTKLANQVREDKSWPWPQASNVKYPLLSTAAMQFAARAYPSLVPDNGQVVKSWVIGKDPTGEKLALADRVSTYMSYQIMHEMKHWNEEMDKMLMMLPIVGTMFKKTFYDKSEDKIVSKLVMPKNLVVNYWTKTLDECERVSEIIEVSQRVVEERMASGFYRDIDLGTPPTPEQSNNNGHTDNDETTPWIIIEQHTFLKLKEKEIAKPYIVTFELSSGKILRIQNRYNKEDVTIDAKGKIIKIKPIQVYTKFGFIPNPDGSFYDIGFGVLLGPLNESVNTIINQLVDSGTLNNLQSGFIGKGIRMRLGDQRIQPGEWRPVQATGDDLRKQIVPLPSKEPSNVLFQLMGTLVTSGKELASVAEIFVGKMPGQNTPATTTMASIEQGMKVFTAVYKRIFRSLAEEFNKIFELNGLYIDPQHYIEVLDIDVSPEDFKKASYDICPGADPSAMSKTEKLTKAQGLIEGMQMFGALLNPIEIATRVFEAQEQPNINKLFSMEVQQSGQAPPPPPDPKIIAIQEKSKAEQAKIALTTQAQQQKMELDKRDKETQLAMKAQEHQLEMQALQEKSHAQNVAEIQKAQTYIATARATGEQKMAQGEQQHQQKMQQQKEIAKSKPSKSTATK